MPGEKFQSCPTSTKFHLVMKNYKKREQFDTRVGIGGVLGLLIVLKQ